MPAALWLQTTSARPSAVVMITLAVMLAAASSTLWLLIRRLTSRRQWVALAEWCRESGFRFRAGKPSALRGRVPEPADAPTPLAALAPPPRVRLWLADAQTALLQVVGGPRSGGPQHLMPGEISDAATDDSPSPLVEPRWNILMRSTEADWKPTGLRPARDRASLLDLFSLSSFPNLGNVDRFVTYGIDSAAARILSASQARALLPPDVGLLLHGRRLMLDFSSRPFDAIEFDRMRALAEQLVAHLPPSA